MDYEMPVPWVAVDMRVVSEDVRRGPFEGLGGLFVFGTFVGADLQRGVPVLLVDAGESGLTKLSYRIGGGPMEGLVGLTPGCAVAVYSRASVRQGMYGPFVAFTALAVQRLCDQCHWTRPDGRRGGRLCHPCAERARRARRRAERAGYDVAGLS